MHIKVRFILTLACLLATSCSSSTNASLPSMTATNTPILIPTATKTFTPTNTPKPTVTFTLEATLVPRIDMPLRIGENGQPLIATEGTVLFDFEAHHASFPDIKELENQLNAEAYTPEFFTRLYDYLQHASVNGNPLVAPFDPDMVNDIEWRVMERPGGKNYSWYYLDSNVFCEPGSEPVRQVFAFNDWERDIFGVVQQIYNRDTKQSVFRTTVFPIAMNGAEDRLIYDGNYLNYTYNFNLSVDSVAHMETTARLLGQELKLHNGDFIYDFEASDEAYLRNGILDPYFDTHVAIGQVASIRIENQD